MGTTNVNARKHADPSHNFTRQSVSIQHIDPAKFLLGYVTMDETWAHHFDPETKLQSKQWKHATLPPLVKFLKLPLLAK